MAQPLVARRLGEGHLDPVTRLDPHRPLGRLAREDHLRRRMGKPQRLEPGQRPAELGLGKAAADIAGMAQALRRLERHHQRGEAAALGWHPADHHSVLALAVLDLDPLPAATLAIGRIDPLADDPFGARRQRLLEHRRSIADDVGGLAHRSGIGTIEQPVQDLLALDERQVAQVAPTLSQDVEHQIDDLAGAGIEGIDQGGKIAHPLGIEHHRLAVENQRGQIEPGQCRGHRAEAMGPVEAFPAVQADLRTFGRRFDAVAVIFDLMQPSLAFRRLVAQLAHHQRQKRRDAARAGTGLALRRRLGRAPRRGPVLFDVALAAAGGDAGEELAAEIAAALDMLVTLLDEEPVLPPALAASAAPAPSRPSSARH